MKKQNPRRVHSIYWRVFTPLLIAVFFQIALFTIAINSTGVITRVEDNALALLAEKTASRQAYTAGEMVGRWSNLADEETELSDLIDAYLADNGRTAQEMRNDWALNADIIKALAPRMIDMLRLNQATGLYCVLDGIGVDGNEDSYAAFYIRDASPETSSANNADLTVLRGMPTLARSLELSLSGYWQASCTFDDPHKESAAFFFAPIQTARQNNATEGRYFGRWSTSFRFADELADYELFTYSVPLIGQNGEVYGVLGVELSIDYVARMLSYDELTSEKRGVYVLGMTQDGGQSYSVVCKSGPAYQSYFGTDTAIVLSDSSHGELKMASSASGDPRALLASVQPIRLYEHNTPFEGEEWALISIVPQEELLGFSNQFRTVLGICEAAILIAGIVVALFVSRAINSPISSLVSEVRLSDPNKAVKLSRTAIQEIDELSASIETLSSSVAESSSRISQIITMAHIPLGVFEYSSSADTVYFSETLFDVLGWPDYDPDKIYSKVQLLERLNALEQQIYDQDAHVYQIQRPGESRPAWVQINLENHENKRLGVVRDVTAEISQKRKIEYERDYDTLTNILNRRAFKREIDALFDKRRQDLQVAALLMMDLDNLKYLNDKYGHDLGDRYIQAFSQKVRLFERYGALVGRRSGDEFYILLYGYRSKDEIRTILHTVLPQIKVSELLLPDGDIYKIRASGGLTWYPDDATEPDDLIRYADFAMYSIKRSVKGDIAEFDRKAYNADAILINGAEALNRMIEGGHVRYALQTIVDTRGGIYGYEMLMRPQIREFSSPLEVLRIARAQSKMQHIERMTWEKSLQTFSEQCAKGSIVPNAKVFINSTSSHTLSPAVRAQIESDYPELLGRVVLEITEGEQQNDANFQSKMEMIHAWNGMIAIDDFGTGYNSELSLISYAPDIVKLDMSMVRNVDRDSSRQRLIAGVLDYAHARGILVLAEGVETLQEMRALVLLGVDLLQGYYVAHPGFEPEPIDPDVITAIRIADELRDAGGKLDY